MLTRKRLYFWHVPKTAGTSFIQWLDSQFDAHKVFSPQLLPQLNAATDEEIHRSQMFRGHLGDELPRRLRGDVETVTLLREPLARTVSHLNHIWREQHHYLHERLQEHGRDLQAVLKDPLLRLAVCDVQARYLALSPRDTATARLTVLAEEHLREQARYELAPLPRRHVLIPRATGRLHSMSAFGFAEHLDAFAARLARHRGWTIPSRLPSANVASASPAWRMSDLAGDDVRLLRIANSADTVLYTIARSSAKVVRAVRW